MGRINRQVWLATSSKYILYGTITKEKELKGWAMVKVDWVLPHKDYKIDSWQRLANLGLGHPRALTHY
jgi:hypothetical protein